MKRFPGHLGLAAAALLPAVLVLLPCCARTATESAVNLEAGRDAGPGACSEARPEASAQTDAADTSLSTAPPEPVRDRHRQSSARKARPTPKQIAEPGAYLVFAAIADSHLRDAGYADARYIKAMDRCREALAAYVRDINAHDPPVNFAIHLGDLTDLGTAREFEMAQEIMDSLDCTLYPVLGNHDNFKSDAKAGWLAFAGRSSATYAFDAGGLHFIVIDCTLDPYQPPYVNCDSTLRAWVAGDLAANPSKPTILLSHYNMWQRHWNAMFDTTLHYAEYRGMPEMRAALEAAGNVVAVVNGHVHANRVEKHNGIYYVDVAATIVGPPSIRYFYVYPDRIEVDFAYLSDEGLFSHVTDLCDQCCCCFSPEEVCDFVDGTVRDKRFAIPLGAAATASVEGPASPGLLAVEVKSGTSGAVRATICSDAVGPVDISLHDVLGRRLDRCCLWKGEVILNADLAEGLEQLRRMPAGIYFLRVSLAGAARTEKMVLFE